MSKPFEKDFPAKDNYKDLGNKRGYKSRNVPPPNDLGRNNQSYQYGREGVHTFNSNTSTRSPTTSSGECKKIDKNKYLKMPFKR